VDRFRFSLVTLLGVVCAAAAVLGAWRHDRFFGTSVTFVLTMSVLSLALMASIFGTEPTRRFCMPFSICAGGYLAIAMCTFADALPGEIVVNQCWGRLTGHHPRVEVRVTIESIMSLPIGVAGSFVFNVYRRFYERSRERNRGTGRET
jgi:xanthine/uracil permease